MSDKDRVKQNATLAMRLIVEWRKMRTACLGRSTCEGCPYFDGKECSTMSTETVLEKAADAFNEYLISE